MPEALRREESRIFSRGRSNFQRKCFWSLDYAACNCELLVTKCISGFILAFYHFAALLWISLKHKLTHRNKHFSFGFDQETKVAPCCYRQNIWAKISKCVDSLTRIRIKSGNICTGDGEMSLILKIPTARSLSSASNSDNFRMVTSGTLFNVEKWRINAP